MSLRTEIVSDIINDCDYYKDIIDREEYIPPWSIIPYKTYNISRKCWQLEKKRNIYNPKIRGEKMDAIFDYKINKPLWETGKINVNNRTNVKEFFDYSDNENNYHNLSFIILLVVIIIIFVKFNI